MRGKTFLFVIGLGVIVVALCGGGHKRLPTTEPALKQILDFRSKNGLKRTDFKPGGGVFCPDEKTALPYHLMEVGASKEHMLHIATLQCISLLERAHDSKALRDALERVQEERVMIYPDDRFIIGPSYEEVFVNLYASDEEITRFLVGK